MTWKVFLSADALADPTTVLRVEAATLIEAARTAQERWPGLILTKILTHQQWKDERDERRRLRGDP